MAGWAERGDGLAMGEGASISRLGARDGPRDASMGASMGMVARE